MTDHVKSDLTAGVLTLTLARAEKKNALTDAMYKAFADALEAAETDPATRVILIQGEGDAFTAGNDIADFAAANAGSEGPRNVFRFLLALAHATKPLVAAVQGNAVGVGATMLFHCDQVIVAEDARIAAPFVGLGLVPEAASSILIPARIGHARAFSMFALGEVVGAADAVAWGIANKAVARDTLADNARAIAVRIAALPPAALRATKRFLRDAGTIAARMDEESAEFRRRLASPEAAEAFAAFAERRTPDFSRF